MTTNLMALPIRTVIDAYNSMTGEALPYTAADKIKAATWLANQGHTPGSLTGAVPKTAPVRPAAATATTSQVEQRILSLGRRAKYLLGLAGAQRCPAPRQVLGGDHRTVCRRIRRAQQDRAHDRIQGQHHARHQ